MGVCAAGLRWTYLSQVPSVAWRRTVAVSTYLGCVTIATGSVTGRPSAGLQSCAIPNSCDDLQLKPTHRLSFGTVDRALCLLQVHLHFCPIRRSVAGPKKHGVGTVLRV